MNYFANNLKYLTKNTQINQNQLAIKLGINRQQVTKWINGGEPKYDYLINISKIYEISIDDLLKKDLSEEDWLIVFSNV